MSFLDFSAMDPQEGVVILILMALLCLIYFSAGLFVGITWFKVRNVADRKADEHRAYYGDFWERDTP